MREFAMLLNVPVGNALLMPLNWQDLFLRLLVSLIVGAIIGFERELRQKAAGLRTHMLVSLGTTFFVLISLQIGLGQNTDALSRIFQGIITGIGFIGGGVILHNRNNTETERTRGLTTAAAIWFSCALGIASGCGLWLLALIGAILALFILRTLKRFEKASKNSLTG